MRFHFKREADNVILGEPEETVGALARVSGLRPNEALEVLRAVGIEAKDQYSLVPAQRSLTILHNHSSSPLLTTEEKESYVSGRTWTGV